MLRHIIESLSLATHDALSSAASMFTVDPQIKEAHTRASMDTKNAKGALADAKTTRRVVIGAKKAAHTEERKALVRKQAAEMELLRDAQDTLVDVARDGVANAKASGRAAVHAARDRLLVARLHAAAEKARARSAAYQGGGSRVIDVATATS